MIQWQRNFMHDSDETAAWNTSPRMSDYTSNSHLQVDQSFTVRLCGQKWTPFSRNARQKYCQEYFASEPLSGRRGVEVACLCLIPFSTYLLWMTDASCFSRPRTCLDFDRLQRLAMKANFAVDSTVGAIVKSNKHRHRNAIVTTIVLQTHEQTSIQSLQLFSQNWNEKGTLRNLWRCGSCSCLLV